MERGAGSSKGDFTPAGLPSTSGTVALSLLLLLSTAQAQCPSLFLTPGSIHPGSASSLAVHGALCCVRRSLRASVCLYLCRFMPSLLLSWIKTQGSISCWDVRVPMVWKWIKTHVGKAKASMLPLEEGPHGAELHHCPKSPLQCLLLLCPRPSRHFLSCFSPHSPAPQPCQAPRCPSRAADQPHVLFPQLPTGISHIQTLILGIPIRCAWSPASLSEPQWVKA